MDESREEAIRRLKLEALATSPSLIVWGKGFAPPSGPRHQILETPKIVDRRLIGALVLGLF